MTRTLSIAIKENTYQELKSKIGSGKISSFVNQAVEKELKELVQEQQKKREQLKRQLIKGYQARVRNKDLQKILRSYGETSWENISAELDRREKKDAKK